MHIKGMWKVLVPFPLALLLLFAVGNIIFAGYISPFFLEKESLKQNAFSCVFESSKQPQDDGQVLRKLNGLFTFTGPGSKQMNAHVYVQTGTAFPIHNKLQAGEVALSEKMAEKLGATEGDNISVEFTGDMPAAYRVKEILPYMSDFYDVRDSEYFSVGILGEDTAWANYIHSQWVYFVNEQKCQAFLQGEIPFSKSRNVKLEIEWLKSLWVWGNVACGTLLFILVGVIIACGHLIICRETLKYYYEGFDTRVIKKMEWADHLLFLGLPIIGEMIWMSSHYEWFVPYVFWGVVLGFPLLLGISVWRGGKKYDKVA